MTVLPLVGPFLIALLVSLGGTLLCERLARRARLITHPREDRWHRESVPLLGGVAIMLGVAVVGAGMGTALGRFGPFLLLAAAMGAVGLVDDIKALRPPTKVAAQVVAAAVLIHFGTPLPLTTFPVVNLFLTFFWVIGITNAFNLLDNMDGLAGGVAALTAIFRLAFFVIEGDRDGAWMMAGLLGALGGFLIRNYPPAKIFMGDAGSFFLGFFLSGISVVSAPAAYTRGTSAVLVFPVLLVLVPILDTAFVTVTRLLTGRPVSQGGRDHTSHRLVALGMSEGWALTLLLGISALSGLVAVLSSWYGFAHSIVLLALLAVGLALLGVHLSRAQVVAAQTARPETPAMRLLTDFQYKRQVAMVVSDVVLIVIAYYTAHLLRFEADPAAMQAMFLGSVGPVLGLQILTLVATGSYRGLWRYTGLPDLLHLLRAVTLGVGVSVLYVVFTTRIEAFSRAVFVVDWLLLVILLGGSRVGYRLLAERLRPPSDGLRRALIYGAGDGGALTLRALRNDAALRREVVGFLDDDRSKRGTRIHGLPVLGGIEMAEEILAAQAIGEVIVSSERIPPERARQLEAMCTVRGVTVTRATLRIE